MQVSFERLIISTYFEPETNFELNTDGKFESYFMLTTSYHNHCAVRQTKIKNWSILVLILWQQSKTFIMYIYLCMKCKEHCAVAWSREFWGLVLPTEDFLLLFYLALYMVPQRYMLMHYVLRNHLMSVKLMEPCKYFGIFRCSSI
jgi:hypothetical protein